MAGFFKSPRYDRKVVARGFTLIELLIVVAILAILAVAVVLVLNPAELLKQARDATRISDLAAVNSAIALYLADQTSPSLGGCSTSAPRCTVFGATSPFTVSRTAVCTAAMTSTTTVAGSGWIDVNFSAISSGSPLGRLPTDPTNSTSLFYAYACTGTTYQIDGKLESTKYTSLMTSDGGTTTSWYEVGNSLATAW